MDLGWVLGGALRLVRRRRVLLLGMAIALLGLVYVLIDTWARLNNKSYLSDLANSLGQTAPPNLGLYLAAGLLIAGLGGLSSEAGLILSAGRRLATSLPPTDVPSAPARSGVARLLRLLGVAGRIWWPLLLIAGLLFLPTIYWLITTPQSDSWAAIVLGSLFCTSVVFLIGWWILWPINRLANCAALLDGLPAGPAARLGRTLWRRNLGSVLGLWLGVSVLNLVLAGISAGLAALGALVVWEVLQVVNSALPAASGPAAAGVAVLVGLLLLAWDGAVTAFNLNTWMLAYYQLRTRATAPLLLATAAEPSGQALGRLRQPTVEP